LAALLSVTALSGCMLEVNVTPTQTDTTAPTSQTTPLEKEDPMLPVTKPGEANTDGVTQLRLHNVRGNWMRAFQTDKGMYFVADSIPSLLDGLKQRGLDTQKLSFEDYDEEFFQQYRLVVIPRRTNSGSVRFSARIENVQGVARISTVGNMPQVGTADMADWLVLVPLSKAEYPGDIVVDDVKNVPATGERYARHRF
jgi:hypothetical protein